MDDRQGHDSKIFREQHQRSIQVHASCSQGLFANPTLSMQLSIMHRRWDHALDIIPVQKCSGYQCFPSHLFVVHDTQRRGHHNVAELTRGQEVVGPLLDLADGQIEARGDDTALVDTTNELDHNLSAAVIIDHLELPNVS